MSRHPRTNDQELVAKVTEAFRKGGFDGTSLSALSAATGLQRASLYHRFPGGKEEMAEEALTATKRWVDQNVVGVLRGLGTPHERLDEAAKAIGKLHHGGQQACLVNLFGTPASVPPNLRSGVQAILSAMISAIASVLEEAGVPGDEARARAMRGVILVQGALVVARGFGDTAPFDATMAKWADDLLGPQADETSAPPTSAREVKPHLRADPEGAAAQVRLAVARHLQAQRGRAG